MKKFADISSFERLAFNARVYKPSLPEIQQIEQLMVPYSERGEDSPLTWLRDAQVDLVVNRLMYGDVSRLACERAIGRFQMLAKKFVQMYESNPNPDPYLREVRNQIREMDSVIKDFYGKLQKNTEIKGVL